MNITILNRTDIAGGAAKAVYRLHKGFIELNHNTLMIVKHKTSEDPRVNEVRLKSIKYRMSETLFSSFERYSIHNNRSGLTNSHFSLPYPGYNLSGEKIIRQSDVINLHWIVYFQSVETIASLLSLDKPVIWTLHDQWPFTGGCHYSAGCNKYEENCLDCPQIENKQDQIPFLMLEDKINTFGKSKNLTIVTPSHWLGDCAKKSRVFGNRRIEVIPNSLETKLFVPIPKKEAKEELGLNPEAITLLFGAEIHGETRKGYKEFFKTINFCMKDKSFRRLVAQNKAQILSFGVPPVRSEDIGIPIIHLGFLKDDKKITLAYSASDLHILTSLEDNLPNTMLESMSCGTPVIAFKTGGIPDIVRNGQTGYTVPQFDCEKLSKKILELIFDDYKRIQISINCRKTIESKFKLSHQASNYSDLFDDLLKSQPVKKRNGDHFIINQNKNQIILNGRESNIHNDLFHLYSTVISGIIKLEDSPVILRIIRAVSFFLHYLIAIFKSLFVRNDSRKNEISA